MLESDASLMCELQGSCSTAKCPYLHVRHDPDTPVCRDFLAGFCPKGQPAATSTSQAGC